MDFVDEELGVVVLTVDDEVADFVEVIPVLPVNITPIDEKRSRSTKAKSRTG